MITLSRRPESVTLDEYQEFTATTAVFPRELRYLYPALKLNGEAGEVGEKIAKMYRDDAGQLSESRREDLLLELGDVLWYLAALSDQLGYSLGEVALANVEKLESRRARGAIHGDGDHR
jgi:NTP pyrophosphatase (non-canonical NTP hydrolase)